jgi:hypothetical protein
MLKVTVARMFAIAGLTVVGGVALATPANAQSSNGNSGNLIQNKTECAIADNGANTQVIGQNNLPGHLDPASGNVNCTRNSQSTKVDSTNINKTNSSAVGVGGNGGKGGNGGNSTVIFDPKNPLGTSSVTTGATTFTGGATTTSVKTGDTNYSTIVPVTLPPSTIGNFGFTAILNVREGSITYRCDNAVVAKNYAGSVSFANNSVSAGFPAQSEVFKADCVKITTEDVKASWGKLTGTIGQNQSSSNAAAGQSQNVYVTIDGKTGKATIVPNNPTGRN